MKNSEESIEWMPFETAPKDGSVFRLKENGFVFTHGFYREGLLYHIEYMHTNRPTHWAILNHEK